MYQAWLPLLPGFTRPLTAMGFLLGLLWLVAYSLRGVVLIVLPYNCKEQVQSFSARHVLKGVRTMSIEAVDQVLQRWFIDPTFRNALANNPKAVLEGYDLDTEERERLSRIKGRRHPTTRRSKGTSLSAERLGR